MTFKLKYKNSAFPFKSPLRHEGDGNHPRHHTFPSTREIPSTVEEWDVELKKTQSEIGNPKKWTKEGRQKWQNKLWEYEDWRKTQKDKGVKIYDTSNKKDEYIVKERKDLLKEYEGPFKK